MNHRALTPSQQEFAAEHHNIIFSFMRSKGLDAEEYYDVVVFGYLNAVVDYLTKPVLQLKYEFSTIAYRSMNFVLLKHYEKLNRLKRKGFTISLEATVYGDDEVLSLQEVIPSRDSTLIDFETELLMIELASLVSKPEMEILRMKADGYGVKDIAKDKKMSVRGVTALLAGVQDAVFAVCCR